MGVNVLKNIVARKREDSRLFGRGLEIVLVCVDRTWRELNVFNGRVNLQKMTFSMFATNDHTIVKATRENEKEEKKDVPV